MLVRSGRTKSYAAGVVYGCRCSPLCDDCVRDAVFHLGGMAQAIGTRWAEAIARVVPLDRPWPATTERMLAIARRKVGGMSQDDRLRERFTEMCIEGAANWWDNVLRKGLWRVS